MQTRYYPLFKAVSFPVQQLCRMSYNCYITQYRICRKITNTQNHHTLILSYKVGLQTGARTQGTGTGVVTKTNNEMHAMNLLNVSHTLFNEKCLLNPLTHKDSFMFSILDSDRTVCGQKFKQIDTRTNPPPERRLFDLATFYCSQ